jgi:hypothetical protein
MPRIGSCLACALALLLAVSAVRAHAPADPAGLRRAVFALGDERYRILLPQRAALVPASGQVQHVVIRDESKSKRLERLLLLGRKRRADTGLDRTVTLAGGGILRYRIDIDTGGGSGGPVAELTGWLQLGTRSLGVICTDQDELLREPEWCIPYLHHLEPVE